MIIINKKRLFLFWQIGKTVCQRHKYFDNVIERYADIFKYKYGCSSIFTRKNIFMMKMFYIYFPVFIDKIAMLTWEHYLELIRIGDCRKRNFYFYLSLFCSCSYLELQECIEKGAYELLLGV